MKKKLIATAVAGALAIPAVAVAEEHTTFRVYGRVNNALDYTKVQGASGVWGFRNASSRWGLQGSSDLGNGLTAVGHYEFFTFTNREGNRGLITSTTGVGSTVNSRGGIQDTRLGFVGLSGGFGTITIGNQWSSFYNTVGAFIDPTTTLATTGYVAGLFRTSNTVKYANTFGPVYVDLDVRISNTGSPAATSNADNEAVGNDHGEDVDGAGIGFTWGIGDAFSLAAAYDADKTPGGDTKRTGIAGQFRSGAWWATLYWNQIENPGGNKVKGPGAWVGGSWGKTSAFLGYGVAQDVIGAGGDQSSWTLNVTHNFGAGFRMYFEGITTNNKNFSDVDTLLFGLRYDFSS